MQEHKTTIRVWDPLVRIGHWGLVIGFFTAYFAGDELLEPHVWAGYAVGLILVLRIAWGFVGSKPARFASFVRSPLKALGYLRSLARTPRHYLSHNPAGGLMTVVLLAVLTFTTVSGLIVFAEEQQRGPLAPVLAADLSPLGNAHADDEPKEYSSERGRAWGEMHEISSKIALGLIIVHMLGVAVSSWRGRENLVLSMFNGRKKIDPDSPPVDEELLRPR